jgi:thiamine-phosphate pyrophosphorylase
MALPRRLALTDPLRAPDPFALLATLPQGAGLIWRAYDAAPSREALQGLARAARRKHVTLFVALAPEAGRRARFHNRHLAEHQLEIPYTDHVWLRARRGACHIAVTAAAHSERAVMAAARAGVDAVLISPVFATASHPGAATLGALRFAALARLARKLGIEAYALGGVTDPGKIRRLTGSGATGVAGIGLFTGGDQA